MIAAGWLGANLRRRKMKIPTCEGCRPPALRLLHVPHRDDRGHVDETREGLSASDRREAWSPFAVRRGSVRGGVIHFRRNEHVPAAALNRAFVCPARGECAPIHRREISVDPNLL